MARSLSDEAIHSLSWLWIASSPTLLAMTTGTNLTLRAVIGAAFVAAGAVDADPRAPPRVLDPFPDEARQVLQRRGPERLDLVEQLVVQHLLHLRDGALEQAEIEHHPRRGIGRAAHGNLGAKRVAVDLLAGRAQCRSRQRMGRLEPERFRQFPHSKNPTFI